MSKTLLNPVLCCTRTCHRAGNDPYQKYVKLTSSVWHVTGSSPPCTYPRDLHCNFSKLFLDWVSFLCIVFLLVLILNVLPVLEFCPAWQLDLPMCCTWLSSGDSIIKVTQALRALPILLSPLICIILCNMSVTNKIYSERSGAGAHRHFY